MLQTTLNNLLLPNVVLPAVSRFTDNQAWVYLQRYLDSDYEDPADRKARQWQRLKRLLVHAYTNTAFYRERMDSVGLTPDKINTPEDFRRIPVTTKQDLRDNFPDGIIARNMDLRDVRISNTSGTSGRPVVLAQDHDDINRKYASKVRTRYLAGVNIGDRIFRIAPNECQPCFTDGSSPDVGLLQLLKMRLSGDEDYNQAYYIFMERGLVNKYVHQRTFPPPLDHNNLEADVQAYLDEIVEKRPQLMSGHPLYLYLVARMIERTGEDIRFIKAVDCTGDLSTGGLRAYLGRVFKAPVYQIYGGCEWGRMSGSCGHGDGSMHILEDIVYPEFLTPDNEPVGDREVGNFIGTNLTNYAMPLIRFEHGDVGWLTNEPCSCGRTSPRIDIEGRLQALIVRPDGRAIPSSAFMERVIPNKGVLLFKVVQHEMEKFELIYRPDLAEEADEDALRADMLDVLGGDAEVEITRVDVLDPAPSGKFRLVKSTSYSDYRVLDPAKREAELGEYW